MAAGEQNGNDESPSNPANGDHCDAPEKSPGTPRRRPIPPQHEHVQANFCKTPGCANFGVVPREGVSGQGRGKAEDDYKIIGAGSTTLVCKKCSVTTRLKSNLAIYEEWERQATHLRAPVQSVRRARRMWHIYAPYDPIMVEKLLTIYRVWHNYVWINKKSGRTAAEVIGLAQGKVRPQDIIYFT